MTRTSPFVGSRVLLKVLVADRQIHQLGVALTIWIHFFSLPLYLEMVSICGLTWQERFRRTHEFENCARC